MKNQNLSFNLQDKIEFICRIEQEYDYSDKIIKEYEDLYKIQVMEEIADLSNELSTNDEEAEDIETTYLTYYNANNLVDWYKNLNN